MRRVLFVSLVCLLMPTANAAHKYHVTEIVNTGAKLSPDSSVLITVPKDGAFNGRVYSGSGQQTAEATRNALTHRLTRVSLAAATTTEAGLAEAGAGGYTYLCIPEVLHWEDRATEWSGKRDKIEVKLTVYEVSSGKIIKSAIISSVSKWMTFGGDHPQELVDAHIHVLTDPLF
jgi:hypothetical protein